MSGEVREVWGAYHERERLCPEGVRVVEIAHVHYAEPPRDRDLVVLSSFMMNDD